MKTNFKGTTLTPESKNTKVAVSIEGALNQFYLWKIFLGSESGLPKYEFRDLLIGRVIKKVNVFSEMYEDPKVELTLEGEWKIQLEMDELIFIEDAPAYLKA